MKIKINPLNGRSIQDAIDKIESYRRSLEHKDELIIKRLVEIGVEYAKSLAPEVAHLISSEIEESPNGLRGIIRAEDEAVYVEFGTGARGLVNPYPKTEVMEQTTLMYKGFQYTGYLSGERIFTTKDGRVGWLAPIGEGGKYRFTEGVYAKAFMYHTARYLRSIEADVVKEVLSHGQGQDT